MENKICNKCLATKSLLDFYKTPLSKDGYFNYCKSCANKITNIWKSKNPEKTKEIDRGVKKRRRSHYRNYERQKYNTDPIFRLKKSLRSRIRKVLKNAKRVGSPIKDLGCTLEELKVYIESKFVEGMTWENHGQWHIDHIRPLSSFDLTNKEQFLQACHFANLQPLWAEENLRKSDKYEEIRTVDRV